MGDMGQREPSGRKKRPSSKRRRSGKKRDLLAWLPDGRFPNANIQQVVHKKFLNGSFVMSNTSSFVVGVDKVTEDMQSTMKMLGSAVSDAGSCDVLISGPSAGSPYWENDMSMVVDGTLRETFVQSLDANEMMQISVGWINQQVTR